MNDSMRERLIYGAELVGKYDFPAVPPIGPVDLRGLNSIPFSAAKKEKCPKLGVCHFFIDDQKFERVWTHPEQYLEILKNFKYVCGPDFSCYDSMPKAMQIWQTYRNRAMAYWFWMNQINVIPTAGWGGPETYSWCFDGLPAESVIAVSTNGCHTQAGRECYIDGFREMCRRLKPKKVLVIGNKITVSTETEVVHMPSYGQLLTQRIGGKQDGIRENQTQSN